GSLCRGGKGRTIRWKSSSSSTGTSSRLAPERRVIPNTMRVVSEERAMKVQQLSRPTQLSSPDTIPLGSAFGTLRVANPGGQQRPLFLCIYGSEEHCDNLSEPLVGTTALVIAQSIRGCDRGSQASPWTPPGARGADEQLVASPRPLATPLAATPNGC